MEIINKYFSHSNDQQISQLQSLEALYREWNEKNNTISPKDINSISEKHVPHSLAIATVVPLSSGEQILDLGFSEGFPGIPLAIMYPDAQFTLLSSNANKLKVAESIAQELGLTNVRTLNGKVDDIRNQKFHYVLSGDEASLKDLMSLTEPVLQIKKAKVTVKKTGIAPGIYFAPGLICLKSGNLEQEIKESNTLPFVLPLKDFFEEPFFKEQHLVYISRQSFAN